MSRALGIKSIASIAVLALGAFFVLHRGARGSDPAATGEADQAVIVHALAARAGDMGVYLDGLGTVTPLAMVNVLSQVNGLVLTVHYQEGQVVQKGDPLIDIDPRPYQAQLQQAEGLLERDQGLLRQAQMELTRYQEAIASHAVAQQLLDDQEHAVAQARGTVGYDMGQVRYAQVQLSYCHIKAPISGRVGLRLVDAGNLAAAGSLNPLVVITQLQPISVVFNVAEDHLGAFQGRTRQAVEVYDRSAEKRIATGTLAALDNQIDPATGTVRCRSEFSNADLALFPNQFVNAKLLVDTLRQAVLVPSLAIQRNGSQAFVFVIDHGKVTLRNLIERGTDGSLTAVDGLRVGDLVATSSFDKLQEGTAVVVEPSAPAANGNGAKP